MDQPLSPFSLLRRLAALAALALVLAPASAQAADEISWMYDPDAVVEIDIGGLSEAELDELEAAPDEYVPGTFELKVDGVTKGVPLADVGIRLKGGFGSSRPVKTGKSGLKVRFDEFVDDQLFFGIKRLTLNNMVQDPSMVHETLTYELFRALGLPASRTGYAFVNLNGAKYGLMLNLETLDEISLPQWFATTGHLYEADAAGVDVRPGQAGTFEVDEGDDEDVGDLEALIAAANDETGDWSDGMSAVADLQAMTTQWAVERYVGHWDGYAGAAESTPDPEDPIRPNNYYLHSDLAGIFRMMPWGTDQTWENNLEFDEPAGGLLFNRCLADASCEALYADALEDVLSTASGLEFPKRVAELLGLLAPCRALEAPPRQEHAPEEIEEAILETYDFAEERSEELAEFLEVPFDPPAEGSPDVLDEHPCSSSDPGQDDPGPGSGQDDPEPSGDTGSPSNASSASPGGQAPKKIPPPSLRRAGAGGVVARIAMPSGGRVRFKGTVKAGGRKIKACKGRKAARRAGKLRLRCSLSRAVRRQLRERRLVLRLTIRIVQADGTTQTFQRRIRLPRTPRG